MSKWVFADSDGITFLANISTQLAAAQTKVFTFSPNNWNFTSMFMSESIKGFQEEFENSTQS